MVYLEPGWTGIYDMAYLLSRRSVLSICSSVSLFVCLSVCLSVAKMQKTRFYQKLSNLELCYLLTTYRKLRNWGCRRTHYWIPKIQDG